jgi:polyisoprenoid-binding protein YceI
MVRSLRVRFSARLRRCWLLGALAALSAATAGAETLALEVDPVNSQIHFGFGATLHSVEGSLQIQGGAIHFDTVTGVASGQIAAAATTANTGVKARDRKMHQKILESATYPTINYTVDRIDGAIKRSGVSELQLHGKLTLHGVTQPAAVIAQVRVQGDLVHAHGLLVVPYLTYGMADPSFFILRVEKEVKITLDITGRLVQEGSTVTADTNKRPQ